MRIPEELYARICGIMPIPCVDIIATDEFDRILLVKRRNEPAIGEWWFPGGRVCFGETREQTVVRKLKEECGLEAVNIEEIGTYDLILPLSTKDNLSHGITTVFHAYVDDVKSLKLDDQSKSAQWRPAKGWLSENLHEFILQQIFSLKENNKA